MAQFVEFESKATNPETANVLDVDPGEVRDLMAKIKLIDVRAPDEYVGEYGHVPGAELITLNYLADKLDDLPKDQTIVFICRSGGRSARATSLALQSGFTSVYNMKGGMIAWTDRNFEAEEKNS